MSSSVDPPFKESTDHGLNMEMKQFFIYSDHGYLDTLSKVDERLSNDDEPKMLTVYLRGMWP